MTDFIIGAIVVVILAAAGLYIYKAKRRGVRCIGCPNAGSCGVQGAHEHCHCGCCGDVENEITPKTK